jgi:hypothetical protein
MALVAGSTRVPRPATGNTALRIFMSALRVVGAEQSHVAALVAATKGITPNFGAAKQLLALIRPPMASAIPARKGF